MNLQQGMKRQKSASQSFMTGAVVICTNCLTGDIEDSIFK